MKEIQEKRIENELSILKNSLINIKKVNKEEYFIDVTLPHKIVDSQSVTTDINFLIHMVANFPFNQPRVYCKTPVNIF